MNAEIKYIGTSSYKSHEKTMGRTITQMVITMELKKKMKKINKNDKKKRLR